MRDENRYYDLAERAAQTGEIAFLKHCIDEILKQSASNGSPPEYARIFKTLFEARLHFLNRHTERCGGLYEEAMPEEISEKLRDLEALASALQAVAEGRPVEEIIGRLKALAMHPVRPNK